MKRLSIRFRMTAAFLLLFVIMLLVSVLLSRLAGKIVLEKTLRGYLVSAVNRNVDMISVLETGQEGEIGHNDILISYQDKTLLVHEPFLQSIYDVESALYDQDGDLLYGKNLLSGTSTALSFKASRIYRYSTGGTTYFVYDRELTGENQEGLWIRGIVPLTDVFDQLSEMNRILFIFLPILIVLSAFLCYILAGRLLLPIRAIDETASEISQGTDLTRRIQIGQGSDELHRLADTFNGMFDRLEQSFVSEQRFASDASHELRTPVSVIMAQTEYTLEKDRETGEYIRSLRVIRRQGKRMEALINAMLMYARMENKADFYPMEQTDLSSLVLGICSDMELLEVRGITLTWSIEQEIRIRGNRILLERLLQNLIDNAYKYGEEKGHIHVTLAVMDRAACLEEVDGQELPTGTGRTCQTDRVACLAVADDGIGIAKEDQKKIFARFFRADPSRTSQGQMQGFGFGLATVKKIMELHDGLIILESQQGAGSCFQCFFPL